MCGHHMVSEASAPRFVFRSRASPACDSECVKLTVDSRVFDVYALKVMCAIKNMCEGIVVGCQPRTICAHKSWSP
jgi:hypothetical protein